MVDPDPTSGQKLLSVILEGFLTNTVPWSNSEGHVGERLDFVFVLFGEPLRVELQGVREVFRIPVDGEYRDTNAVIFFHL